MRCRLRPGPSFQWALIRAAGGISNPQARKRLAQIGADPVTGTPEEFVSFLRAEIAKWTKVVKEANIRVD